MFRYEVDDNGVVYKVEKDGNITTRQAINTLNAKLTADKPSILADGIDKATITAEVYNYLDEPQTTWTGDVVFVLDGVEQIVPTANGVASVTFNTTVKGEYAFKTNIPNFGNGEVKVVAE